MKRLLVRVALFAAVFIGTAVLRRTLDMWLSTFELPAVDDASTGLSLDSYVLVLSAIPYAVAFLAGGACLGLVAGTWRKAALWGLLLGGVFVAGHLAVSGATTLLHRNAFSSWQAALSWANLWAPLAAGVLGAAASSFVLHRARGQNAT